MNTELAIQKAVEGGWHNEWQFNGYDPEYREKVYFQSFSGGELYDHDVLVSEAVLDPKFFVALGKTEGWEVPKDYRPHRKGSHSDDWGGESDYPCDCDKPKDASIQQHRLIDVIQQGRSIDEFFGEIL